MAGGNRLSVFGPRSRRFDQDYLDGIGAGLRIAIGAEDNDEGDRRMRELIEQMRKIEARPVARDKPSPRPSPAR